MTVAGQRIDPLTIHKVCFVLWLVVTGAHVLARTIPAVQLTTGRRDHRLPGRVARAAVVAVTLVASVVTGVVVVNLPTDWHNGQLHQFDGGSDDRGGG